MLRYSICSGVQACAPSGLAATCLNSVYAPSLLFSLLIGFSIPGLLISGNEDRDTQMDLTPVFNPVGLKTCVDGANVHF